MPKKSNLPHINLVVPGTILLAVIWIVNAELDLIYLKKSATASIDFNQTTSVSDRLISAINQPLIIVGPNKDYIVSPNVLHSWVVSYYRSFTNDSEYKIDDSKIQSYLSPLAKSLVKAPVDAKFNVDENGNLIVASPAQNGHTLDILSSAAAISQGLAENRSSVNLVLKETEPDITYEKANTLGINTLIGTGQSNFAGSPSHRAHNISVGAEIFNGIIVKPGEDFSFNNNLGDVTASQGYLPELVIKNHQVIPEYGGGLCQVSTTLFRAAMASGLPILERHFHSFPVHYYNPQGYDATIYPGVSDLRFKNDTNGYILIQSKIDGTKISFDIYGSSDGRKVSINGPVIYQSNPDGSMKTVIKRTITYVDGTSKNDSFYSNYQSPGLFTTVTNPYE